MTIIDIVTAINIQLNEYENHNILAQKHCQKAKQARIEGYRGFSYIEKDEYKKARQEKANAENCHNIAYRYMIEMLANIMEWSPEEVYDFLDYHNNYIEGDGLDNFWN